MTYADNVDPDQTAYMQANQALLSLRKPALVAQSDARPAGDQEVAASIPTGSGNIHFERLIMKYFLWSFSPFHWFKKGSCQFLAKEFTQVLVNGLED